MCKNNAKYPRCAPDSLIVRQFFYLTCLAANVQDMTGARFLACNILYVIQISSIKQKRYFTEQKDLVSFLVCTKEYRSQIYIYR